MNAVSPIGAEHDPPGADGHPKVARLRSRNASDYPPTSWFQVVGS